MGCGWRQFNFDYYRIAHYLFNSPATHLLMAAQSQKSPAGAFTSLRVPFSFEDNGLVTYSLSADKKTRAHIQELAALDWGEAMALKKELKD